MLRLKRDRRKVGIALAGTLLFLMLVVWLPVSGADAYEGAAGFVGPVAVTVQATPTEDATVTALNKEQLAQEVAQQQHTWENWLWGNAAMILSSFLSTLVIVVGALFGLWRWRGDQHVERERRAEERFQSVVAGLADEKEGAKVGAAIMLRTFLQPGYEQFYSQAFDLAVVHLRLRKADPTTPEPVDSLSQALITVFRESFPLARDRLEEKHLFQSSPQMLDATGVQLDHAYLSHADLRGIWMPGAHLQDAHLWKTDLCGAHLKWSNLGGAYLKEANLRQVSLWRTGLTGADLRGADLTGTHLERVMALEGTILRDSVGLTQAQRDMCKAKGAIIEEDEDLMVSSSQSTVSTPLSSQSNDAQAQSATPAQEGGPTPDTGSGSASFSKPGLES